MSMFSSTRIPFGPVLDRDDDVGIDMSIVFDIDTDLDTNMVVEYKYTSNPLLLLTSSDTDSPPSPLSAHNHDAHHFHRATACSQDHLARPDLPLLPLEILIHIRDILASASQKSTAAKLMGCSKAFYELFLPVLNYEKVRLSSSRLNGGYHPIFAGILGVASSPFDLSPSLSRSLSNLTSQIPYHPFPMPATHLRKLNHLSLCTHLTIQDLPSALSLIEVHDALILASGPAFAFDPDNGAPTPFPDPDSHIGIDADAHADADADADADMAPRLFPNLEHLTLGSDFVFSILLDYNTEGIRQAERLGEIVRPNHLCVWAPRMTPLSTATFMSHSGIGMEIDNFPFAPTSSWSTSRLSAVSDIPDLLDEDTVYEVNDPARFNGSDQLNRFLATVFHERRLKSFTMHNATNHILPTVQAESYRVLFLPGGLNELGLYGTAWTLVDKLRIVKMMRALRIAQVLPISGPRNETVFEFIGADEGLHPRPGTRRTRETGEEERTSSESEASDWTVQDIIWGFCLASIPKWDEEAKKAISFLDLDRSEAEATERECACSDLF